MRHEGGKYFTFAALEIFRFKKFSMQHHESPMPIGTDSVLLGSWVALQHSKHILDVGTGCGLLALMCAQRSENSQITGIDISEKAINESKENATQSPWSNRIKFVHTSLQKHISQAPLDLILSNPPYFDSKGLKSKNTERAHARHNSKLPLDILFEYAFKNLSLKGSLALVLPYSCLQELQELAEENKLHCSRMLRIRPHPNKAFNRLLIAFTKRPRETDTQNLSIRTEQGQYSPEYSQLTQEFYL